MTNHLPSTWSITGASSGIGLALARAAVLRGDDVIAVSRDVASVRPHADEHRRRMLAVAADVRRQADVEDGVRQGVEAFGRIDVVAHNAGYGVFGAVEEPTDEQARIFDTNVFGVLDVLRAALPVRRAQRRGHVLQGSSCSGRTAHPGVGLTTATTYAVEGLTDALVGELEPLGIKDTMVEPGPTATAFGNSLEPARAVPDHDRTVRRAQEDIAALPPEAFNAAERVAAAILEAVDAERPPLRLVAGTTATTGIRIALQRRLDELEACAA